LRRARVGRVVLGVALATVAVVALVVGGALSLLRTDWGGERVRRLALPRVNAAMAGDLALGRLKIGGDRVVMERLALVDPEGNTVATVARLEVEIVPLALLRRRVEVRRAVVTAPELHLAVDGRGLNLARALAPAKGRAPAPARRPAAGADDGGPGIDVVLGALTVERGKIDFRDRRPEADGERPLPPLAIEGLTVTGKGHLVGRSQAFEVELGVRAQAREPLAAPLALSLAARGALAQSEDGRRGDQQGSLRVAIGESALSLSAVAGGVAGTAGPQKPMVLRATLEELRLHPELARVLSSGYPLRVPLSARGRGSWSGSLGGDGLGEGELVLAAAGAEVAVKASVDPAARRIPGLSVRARDIDLGRLLAGAPRSDFGFALDLHGDMDPPATSPGAGMPELLAGVRGQLTFEVPPGRLGGRALGPVKLAVDADRGAYKLVDLVARAPGLRATAGGTASARHLDLRAAVDVHDLGELARSLAPSPPPPPARRRAGGRSSAGARAVEPAFAGTARVNLTVKGTPEVPVVQLVARSPALALAGRTLNGLSARLGGTSRAFSVSASVEAPQPLRLEARGAWAGPARRLTLARLELAYPEATWSLQQRAHLTLARDGSVRVDGLDLRAGSQRLQADVLRRGARIQAAVRIAALDLGRLPRLVLPPALGLAGRLDAEVRAAGTLDRPDVQAHVALAGGRVRDIAVASLKLDARAWGARGAGGVPGSLELSAEASGIAVAKEALGGLVLKVAAPAAGPLDVRLDLRSVAGAGGGDAGTGHIEVRTPVALGALARRLGDRAALLRTPVHVRADIGKIDLGRWAKLARPATPVAGQVSLTLALDGPAGAAEGKLSVRAAGVASGGFPPTDAAVDLTVDAHKLAMTVQVTRRSSVLLDAEASLHLPPLRLLDDRAALARAPLALHAVLGPLELQRLGLTPESERRPPRVLKGRARVEIDAAGTLAAPRVTMDVQARDVRMDETLVGKAHAQFRYDDRRLDSDMTLISANGGTLHLTARAEANLGYPAVLRLDADKVPIDAKLEARDFDVAGFSGITERLRTVGGQLGAAARVTGTLGDPDVQGRIEWKNGVLAVTGFGEYRRIHLAFRGDEQAVTLEELSVESGAGRARVTGRGTRRPGKGYELAAEANLKSFPVYTQGQALGTVTLDAKAEARVSPRRVGVKVNVDEAHVALTERKRKKLQPLARPTDVVLVQDGKPLNKQQARKLAALVAELGADAKDEEAARVGTAAAEARAAGPPPVRISVTAPRDLWVRGKDANLELGLEPGFRVEVADQLRVFGSVLVRRGRVVVVGRRFDIKAGSRVRFTGPPEAPELDVGARHRNDKENVNVDVTIKGTPGDRLAVTVRAPERPELSETQLYTLIVTGRLDLGGGSAGSAAPSEKAASLLGGLLAARLGKVLSQRLPLDVLTVEAGDGLSAARLEAGTYLTDDFYVGYVGRLGADPARLQNRNAVHLEYQLTSRWSLEGEYGDAKTGSADVVWTKHY
jgi:translocation and assembly module TamB